MVMPAFSKTLFAFAAALTFICAPTPVSARHNGGSKGAGGSHGGSSHRGGGSHGGGHSSFKGADTLTVAPGAIVVFLRLAHVSGGHKQQRTNELRLVRKFRRGFSSRPSGNFARNANFRGGSFGSSAASRNFDRFGASQPAVQGSRSTAGRWQSFGNSSGRSMLASARTSGNAMGGGWRSFGNMSRGGGAELSRGYGSNVRADGNWRSFGNSGNALMERNRSGFSSFGMGRVTASNIRMPKSEFSSNRFSTKSAAIVAVLIAPVIFFQPLDGEFQRISLWSLGLRRFRFRQLVLRPAGLLQFVHWLGCFTDSEFTWWLF